VDYFGYPHSDVMHLEERYRRISADTLELVMTVTDAKFYAKPWKSQTKQFKLLPKGFVKSIEGWGGAARRPLRPGGRVSISSARFVTRPGRASRRRRENSAAMSWEVLLALRHVAGQHVVRVVARGLDLAESRGFWRSICSDSRCCSDR
jgi:hypothetical protein